MKNQTEYTKRLSVFFDFLFAKLEKSIEHLNRLIWINFNDKFNLSNEVEYFIND